MTDPWFIEIVFFIVFFSFPDASALPTSVHLLFTVMDPVPFV